MQRKTKLLLRGITLFKSRRNTELASLVHRINSMLCAIRLHAECLQQHAGFRDAAVEMSDACREIQRAVDELANMQVSDSAPERHS